MATSSKRRKVDRSIDREYEDPILLPRHKIFLSHSGAQKEFVEQLCVDLESRHRFPFFDRRPSCLPKGERFPILIKAAVAQCKMMVVVVSKEYFTSKWPMIELNGFMQAAKKDRKDRTLKILPLFYGLTVKEFSDEGTQQIWFKEWETMAKVDERINLDEWKESLRLLGPFNGEVYERDSRKVVAYRKEIVSNICKSIPPDIQYDESHVQGRSKLCQVIRDHFGNTPNSTKGVRVIGLYGVGGMGKTQICKIMCNEMDGEFDGKVCHVELGKQSQHELVKKVLTTLTNTSAEVVQEVGEDKCKDVLKNEEIWKQKSFLTIDNVWDDDNSLEQGKLFLDAPFVEGSWVIITSRLRKTLTTLTKTLKVDEKACFEMPDLDKDDARQMFLHYANNGEEFENREDVDAIEECIKSCYFRKGDGRRWHYHPLSLKALGIFLQYEGEGPRVWKENLQKLKESSYLKEPVNPSFNILRTNFDRLPKGEQELFMDLAMFSPTRFWTCETNLMDWLCLVHNIKKEILENWLRHLVDSALLEDVEMRYGKVSIHDLYREFAELEAQGKLKALDMEERRWVYAWDALPTELVEEPSSSWKKLTRVFISMNCRDDEESGIMSLRTIEWKYCTNLVVLMLEVDKLSGVLNFKDLIRLRSLTVRTGDNSFAQCDPPLKFSIEGLEGLKYLTYFEMVCGHGVGAYVGQLPAALKILEVAHDGGLEVDEAGDLEVDEAGDLEVDEAGDLEVDEAGDLEVDEAGDLEMGDTVVFEQGVLALCTNLVSLKLTHVETTAKDLDLRSCTSLQTVELTFMEGLEIVRLGPSLQSLHISWCQLLVEVCGLDRLVSLLSLKLTGNEKLLKLPSLTGLTRLHTLQIEDLEIDDVPGLDSLVGLKSLTVSRNKQLTSLQGLGDLRALTTLNLPNCQSLCRLSDMSKLTNLRVLNLRDTRVEFHEEDIHMLEGLQALDPILVAYNYRLDFKRHKIMHFETEDVKWGWEEKDLHYPSSAASCWDGFCGGKGFRIRDVESIWRRMPGPATKVKDLRGICLGSLVGGHRGLGELLKG